jgi:uncharacterized protein with GYD domain
MPSYMYSVNYTNESWAKQVKNPKDYRLEALWSMIEGVDGKVVACYYAFGKDDVILIADMPDNVTAAAFSIAVAAGGAVTNVVTTVLMPTEEGWKALNLVATVNYTPPQ